MFINFLNERGTTHMIEEDKQELLISEDTYQGRDLGVTLEAQTCHFKVWSPLAVQMELLLYPPLTGGARRKSPINRNSRRYLCKRKNKASGFWNWRVI